MSPLFLLAALALGQMPGEATPVDEQPAAPAAAAQQPPVGFAASTASAAEALAAPAQPALSQPVIVEPGAARPAAQPSAASRVASLNAPPAPPALPPGADGVPVKVERRRLLKEKHYFLTAGPTYLARGDYYRSPGLMASASYYPRESGGVELKLGLFLSSLTSAGQEVFERTGLVPDAHKPGALAAVGWRQSLGYGKALVGSSLTHLVHFDLQLTGHLGLTFTDRAANPTLAVGPGLLVRTRSMFLQIDAPLLASLEDRSRSSLALGMLPTLSLGLQL